MRHQSDRTDSGATSQFAKLLDAERRLSEELHAAHGRARALLDAVQLGVAEHEARWTRLLSQGFPQVQQRIALERARTIDALTAAARQDAARYAAIGDDEIDRLATEVVDRLLGDA
jgi:uncharacterized protein YukE